MIKEAKKKRIDALDYALNCIVNREDRQNHFSVLLFTANVINLTDILLF